MKDKIILLLIYIASFAVGLYIGNSYGGLSLILRSAMIVLSTVLVIWLFSVISNNSSVFDPYWSVAPAFFACYYWISCWGPRPAGPESWFTTVRFVLIFCLIMIWGIRLTYNFFRGWKGLSHEDWRYVALRKKTGIFYWAVSFLGIQLFPAIMVFTGCLSVWVSITAGYRPMNLIDILGILLTGTAIWLEARADKELHRFNLENKEAGKTINTGLWAISRHPNYLGEITFWWGLYLFALAANPKYWWVIIGPGIITLMFIFISIPMIEKRLMERKSNYGGYREKVPMLLPYRF